MSCRAQPYGRRWPTAFDQIDLETGVGEIERGLTAGYPAAHNHSCGYGFAARSGFVLRDGSLLIHITLLQAILRPALDNNPMSWSFVAIRSFKVHLSTLERLKRKLCGKYVVVTTITSTSLRKPGGKSMAVTAITSTPFVNPVANML